MKELSYDDLDNIKVGEDKDFIENKSIFSNSEFKSSLEKIEKNEKGYSNLKYGENDISLEENNEIEEFEVLISSTNEKTKKIKFRDNAQNHQIEMIKPYLNRKRFSNKFHQKKKKISKNNEKKNAIDANNMKKDQKKGKDKFC